MSHFSSTFKGFESFCGFPALSSINRKGIHTGPGQGEYPSFRYLKGFQACTNTVSSTCCFLGLIRGNCRVSLPDPICFPELVYFSLYFACEMSFALIHHDLYSPDLSSFLFLDSVLQSQPAFFVLLRLPCSAYLICNKHFKR